MKKGTACNALKAFYATVAIRSDFPIVQETVTTKRLRNLLEPMPFDFSPDGKLLACEVMYLDLKKEVWAMKR